MTVVANQVLAGKNELLIGSPIRFDSWIRDWAQGNKEWIY
jgi:hypothetical protein